MNTGGSIFGQIPPVTKNLIIINFIVWLAMFVPSRHLGASLEELGGLHYFGATSFNPVQLVTYMFMHSTGGVTHILFNMFSLWMFGTVLERTFGSARFLFYYMSCGIGAGLIQELAWMFTWEDTFTRLVANGNHMDFAEAREILNSPLYAEQVSQLLNVLVSIGASGAIYGILLAFGMMYPNAPLFLFFVPVPIKAKWMVAGMIVIELLIGLSESAGRSDGIAHFAHLGGMIFGFLIIYYWKKKGTFGGGGYGGY